MGRPKKQLHEKRSQRFNIRYSPAEMRHIRLQAHKAGLEPHEYARRRTLGHIVVTQTTTGRTDPALINELNRIGVNLNQIARAANMGREVEEDWSALIIELRRVLALVMASDGA
ncbi:MAG: MobC family plasmid mobilization relaxosome protein [Parvularculaceae bacterium]